MGVGVGESTAGEYDRGRRCAGGATESAFDDGRTLGDNVGPGAALRAFAEGANCEGTGCEGEDGEREDCEGAGRDGTGCEGSCRALGGPGRAVRSAERRRSAAVGSARFKLGAARSTTASGPRYATRSETDIGRGLGNESSVGARGSTEPIDIRVPL